MGAGCGLDAIQQIRGTQVSMSNISLKDSSIFKKYDIRGRATGDDASLNPEIARLVGAAFGTYLQRNYQVTQVVVGRDNRRASFELARGLIEGLRASGCEVFDLDLVATPVVYWNATRRGDIGGAMVTGSHLGGSENGFKLCLGARNLFGSQLQTLRNLIVDHDLSYGDGKVVADRSSYGQYVEDLVKRLPMARPLKVVLDAGNGVGGLFGLRLVKAWGHALSACLYCDPNPDFPNHPANPADPANLRDLAGKVVELGADLGLAFDGDADRLGVVDERGGVIAPDRLLTLLARDMLARHPNSAVVADVLCSQVLFDEVARAGGRPIMWASGHSLVKAKMAESGAMLGGEMSGHIFLREDYYGFDDSFFAAGRLLQLLAAGERPLSALDAELPRPVASPEYRLSCPDADKHKIIHAVRLALADKGEIATVDGVRIHFERGWGLLRASNTEAVLSLRFEGETAADLEAYRALFAEKLKAFPQVGPLA
jgi:phosphomannomutase/phosphoglucomutase